MFKDFDEASWEGCFSWREQKLVNRGIPSMIDNAKASDPRTGLQAHLRETQGQIARLEQVFSLVGVEPNTKDNDVLDELISTVEDSASNIESPDLRDAALIVNGNLVEHYEIALYGSLAAWACNKHRIFCSKRFKKRRMPTTRSRKLRKPS